MNPAELYDDIRNYCRENADERIVKKYSRYFKEGYDAYGLSNNLLNNKVKSILNNSDINIEFISKTCRLLVKSGKYEETSFAILLLKQFSKEFNSKTLEEINYWFETGINNWAHTDAICREFTSFLLKNRIVNLQSFDKWRNAKNKFQRRAVPVTLIHILKITQEYEAFFEFIEPLMEDNERVVWQGLGWFLREAWKIKKEETESFLLKWKDKAPRLIYQYATEKMSAEEKKRFKKKK
ncbi:hypothetical protein DRQ09_09465 [candidate division KSB1 bacterium]|nr:MAG: hypothetical protein DRQ09_09465 [candidate division KSB1 bacterium]